MTSYSLKCIFPIGVPDGAAREAIREFLPSAVPDGMVADGKCTLAFSTIRETEMVRYEQSAMKLVQSIADFEEGAVLVFASESGDHNTSRKYFIGPADKAYKAAENAIDQEIENLRAAKARWAARRRGCDPDKIVKTVT